MGSRARIVVYASSEDRAAEAANGAFDAIERIEQALSDYRVTSEVSSLRSAAAGEWTPISDDLAVALGRSLEISRSTGGAFDATVGPIVRLWRAASETGVRPNPGAIAEARGASGFKRIELREARAGRPAAVRLLVPGMSLDFGGLGKGLAAQAARDELAARGMPRALVDLGGDLALGAPPPGEAGWTVAVRTGLAEQRDLVLADTCVATSGDTERFSLIDGVRYSHIIDPRTGEPLTVRRAVTVVHPEGAVADALASAACVEGPDGLDTLRASFPRATIHVVEARSDAD
jgi:thiamine biosynthesis lipoprotein